MHIATHLLDLAQAGWLDDLTGWLAQLLKDLFHAGEDLLKDLLIKLIENTLAAWLYVLDSIPVPDFIAQYSLGTLLGAAGPQIGWIMGTFRIGEGLLLLGAGFAFRLTRKALTLGQW
jgi:hypothetical protein